MKILVDDQRGIAELWLTGAEQQDPKLMESLAPLFADWKQNSYKTVVFRSGKRELAQLTEDLLLHNRSVAARRDLAQEQQGFGMTIEM